MTKPDFKYIPITIRYKDKINLAYKLLDIYSEVVEPLTKRNKSLLCMCLLENMNDDDFQNFVIRAKIGITNENQFRQEMYRLKEKGFIKKHDIINRKDLSAHFQAFYNLIHSGDNVGLGLIFDLVKK